MFDLEYDDENIQMRIYMLTLTAVQPCKKAVATVNNNDKWHFILKLLTNDETLGNTCVIGC